MISDIIKSTENEENDDENFSLEISVKYERSFKTWFLIRFIVILILIFHENYFLF